MNKICTSIEQSKKLIELGIDINTADMFCLTTDKSRLHILAENLEKYSRWDCMPAWSLTALLELIPSEFITENKFGKYKYEIKIRKYKLTYNADISNWLW